MVTSCGRLFHAGMVLGKSLLSVCCPVGWKVIGEVASMPSGSPGAVGW